MAVGMSINVLVKALRPGGTDGTAGGGVGKPLPENEKGLKGWIRDKLRSLSEFTLKIRHESNKSIAWHRWSNSQLDTQ